jgi:single-strand DNA-binding protein
MENMIILIGNLTRAPEATTSAMGKEICKFGLATGEKENVIFHNIVTFDKLAQLCEKYLTKGRKVYITGRQINRSYEKDGVKKYVSEVIAHKVLFLSENKNYKPETIDSAEDQFTSDDIPF